MAENQDLVWKATIGDKTYELTRHDISAGFLRDAKRRFGKEYGSYLQFLQNLGLGDVDAVSYALWTAKKNAGVKVPADPSMVNFTLADFQVPGLDETEEAEEAEEEAENPRQPSVEGE